MTENIKYTFYISRINLNNIRTIGLSVKKLNRIESVRRKYFFLLFFNSIPFVCITTDEKILFVPCLQHLQNYMYTIFVDLLNHFFFPDRNGTNNKMNQIAIYFENKR